MPDTLYRVAPDMMLHAGDETLTLTEVSARVVQTSALISELVLIAEVSADDAERAQQNHWFHLAPENCSPQAGGAWRPDVPVQLEARLSADLLTAASLLGEDVWDVLAEVRFARMLPALHQESSWFALQLTQTHPTLKGVRQGLRTTWNDASRV